MKIAELNIGLSSKSLGEITPETVTEKLKQYKFRVITSRTVESTCADGKEVCLACKVELPKHWQGGLLLIAKELGQDCIAVCGFVGHNPYDTFIADLWVSPEETEKAVDFTCEERRFRAVNNSGKLQVWELLIESPRNSDDLEAQAFAELEDAGEFEA